MKDLVNVRREELEHWAKAVGPQDPLTSAADILHVVFQWLLFPLTLGVLVSTFVLGLANVVSFGLTGLALSVVWWLPLSILMGSSWLWLRVPLSRPLLLIPGVLFAELASVYAACHPEMGEWNARAQKQAFCNSWPRSLLFLNRELRKSTGIDKYPEEEQEDAEHL